MAKIRAQIMKLTENEMPVDYDEFLWEKRKEARERIGQYASAREIMHDCLYETG
jgi:hypothetical protein